jgi:hypothetical protein
MTQKVNPSFKRPAESFKTAGAVANASSYGFVVDGDEPTDISVSDGGVDETVLNTFAETSSASSFDVTLDPGEAFVYGSWLVKDTSTTITLSSSTSNQEIFVGWDKSSGDTVIIGPASDFGTNDPKIKMYEFDTDGSGVTAVRNYRPIGQTLTVSEVSILRTVKPERVLRVTPDYGMIVSGDFEVDGVLHIDGTFTASGSISGDGEFRGDGTVRVIE